MAIAYAKLYELILKKVKDEKEAKEFYDVMIELMREGKIEVKNELKEELKDELATKKDIELVRGEMKAMKEEILRYVDNKIYEVREDINQIKILIIVTLLAVLILNPYAYEIVKALIGLK